MTNNNAFAVDEAVEVFKILVGPAPGISAWAAGYVFVREEANFYVVKHTGGVFAGCEVSYVKQDVRPEGGWRRQNLVDGYEMIRCARITKAVG